MKLLKQSFTLFALALPTLCGIVPAHAALSENDRRTYAEAFAAAKRGDWSRGQRVAGNAADPLPGLVLRWLHAEQSGSGANFAEITAFIDAHPDWPGQPQLRRHAEEAIGTATDPQLAAWFALHPPVLASARLRQAQILENSGRHDDAVAMIRQTWIDCDFTAVEEKLMLQRYHSVLRPEDNARRLDRLIWDEQIVQAKRMMRHVDNDEVALAQARLALAAGKRGVEGIVARVPARLLNDPGLAFDRMRWRRRNDLDDDAATILEHAPADLDRPADWANERLYIARRLLDDGEIQRAYRLASSHGLTSGQTFAELEFLAGWIALRELHQPEVAYNHFVGLYDGVKLPISVARGAYWAARAAEEMNQVSLAEAWYSSAAPQVTTYYGQLAASHLGITTSSATLAAPKASAEETAAFEGNELVQAARDLAAIGDAEDLPLFLRRIVDETQTAAGFELAAQLAISLDRPDLAIVAAKHASYAGVTLLDEGYPISHLPAASTAETPLILAMTRQESAFDRGAVSGAGALGMMQLMPATAKKIAKVLRLPFSRTRLTSDVSYNVTLGRAYLNSLIDDFSGSYVLAVAAYNAGPARVHEWMRDHGDPRRQNVDVVDWIERIPITETRNYVQRVLENLQVYRLRLGMRLPAFSLAGDLKR